ncbi:hypothetical protein CCHR01_16770 [Colletotrichum chrysophilum]|uniref:Uncharacterized protein n=1 Tax=Colletotrichum chrysophilum TaxID=1836956 RepID=A0AAD9A501_9PEZI|nr:hypothetical protein CCHR01_16770 [Colletotrichum chrysophilum]
MELLAGYHGLFTLPASFTREDVKRWQDSLYEFLQKLSLEKHITQDISEPLAASAHALWDRERDIVRSIMKMSLTQIPHVLETGTSRRGDASPRALFEAVAKLPVGGINGDITTIGYFGWLDLPSFHTMTAGPARSCV